MRVQGVAPNFQPPSRQTPSRNMWLTIVLCIFLPPVGLIRLWLVARCPLRGKFIISIIALLSMTLMLTVFISARQQNSYLLDKVPAGFQPKNAATSTPIPVENEGGIVKANPAQSGTGTEETQSQMQSKLEEDSDTIQANPMQ